MSRGRDTYGYDGYPKQGGREGSDGKYYGRDYDRGYDRDRRAMDYDRNTAGRRGSYDRDVADDRGGRDQGGYGNRNQYDRDAASDRGQRDRKYDRKYQTNREYEQNRKHRDHRRDSYDALTEGGNDRASKSRGYSGYDARSPERDYDTNTRRDKYDDYGSDRGQNDRDRYTSDYKRDTEPYQSDRRAPSEQRSRDGPLSDNDSGYNADTNRYQKQSESGYTEFKRKYARGELGYDDRKYEKNGGPGSRVSDDERSYKDQKEGARVNKGYSGDKGNAAYDKRYESTSSLPKASILKTDKVKLEVDSSTEESSMSRKSAVAGDDEDEEGECCGGKNGRIIAIVVTILLLLLIGGGIAAGIIFAADKPESTVNLYGSLLFINSTIGTVSASSWVGSAAVQYSADTFCDTINLTLSGDADLTDKYRGCQVTTPGSLVDYMVTLVGRQADASQLGEASNKAINASVTAPNGLLYQAFDTIYVIFTLSTQQVYHPTHPPTTAEPLPCASSPCEYYEMCIDLPENDTYECVCTQCICPDGNWSTTACDTYANFTCTASPKERFNFPDGDSCSKYVACQDSKVAQKMSCPNNTLGPDLIFDPRTEQCEEIKEGSICYRPPT